MTCGAGFSDNSVQDALLSRRSGGKRASGCWRAAFNRETKCEACKDHFKGAQNWIQDQFIQQDQETNGGHEQRAADRKALWWKLTIEQGAWGACCVTAVSSSAIPALSAPTHLALCLTEGWMERWRESQERGSLHVRGPLIWYHLIYPNLFHPHIVNCFRCRVSHTNWGDIEGSSIWIHMWLTQTNTNTHVMFSQLHVVNTFNVLTLTVKSPLNPGGRVTLNHKL